MTALSAKAGTAGDVVVYVPAEKLVFTGNLYAAGRFPDIDPSNGNGTALGWIDGMKQVVDMVPLLKSAMPPPKPNPAKPPPEEKSLEELVTIIPGAGARSNLQEVKSLLEAAQKLRNEVSKAVTAGRSREYTIAGPALAAYRGYANFDPFANRLFDELTALKSK